MGFSQPDGKQVPPIPPETDLEIEVEVLNHVTLNGTPSSATESSPSSQLQYQLEFATFRKEAGNRWFKYGDIMRAGRCYSKGVEEAEKVMQHINAGDLAKYMSENSDKLNSGTLQTINDF